MPGTKSSWTTHILGLERLFALRGPWNFANSATLDRALLEICRPVMIVAAFYTQKPSLMSKPEWKAVAQPLDLGETSFQNPQSNAASDLVFLAGFLAALPALYVECEDCIEVVKTNPSLPPRTRAEVIWSKARQLQQELQAWKENWDDHYCQSEICQNWHPGLVLGLTVSINRTTSSPLESVELATTFAIYHSVVILLISIPIRFCQAGLLGHTTSVPGGSDIQGHSRDPRQVFNVKTSILSIYSAARYLLQSTVPSQAPADLVLFFPVHVARRASIQLGLSAELALMSDAFQMMRVKYPMGVCANMDFDDRFSGFQEGLFG